MSKQHIIIATRESPLALWQANWVKQKLAALHPHLQISLLGVTTQADKLLETSLTDIGGKGLFVKELEQALMEGRADLAVHSMKDVPMQLPEELCIPVMCQREEPRDVLVSAQYATVAQIPDHAVIGTSSLRRQSQLLALRPHLKMKNLRGNVNTRLDKLDQGQEFSALILAAAGLLRLNLQARIRSYLSLDDSLPAAGQGVLGIECRVQDSEIQALIAPLNHAETNVCVSAERAMCLQLGGGCQVPVAAYAELVNGRIDLRGLVAEVDGSVVLRARKQGEISDPESLGFAVAADLHRQGAKTILDNVSAWKKS